MTFYIDGERFETWLREQQASLIQSAQERHQADDERDEDGNVTHPDPTALRMDGGAANMGVILRVLHNFERRADRTGQSIQGRVPMAEIRAPARAKVRRHDPGTSWEAATMQSPEKSQRLYRAIYRLLMALGPMTDDELRESMDARGFEYSAAESVTKRRGELRDAGWVIATDERRRSQDGGTMIVWAAVPEES